MDCEANNKVGAGQGWGQRGMLGGLPIPCPCCLGCAHPVCCRSQSSASPPHRDKVPGVAPWTADPPEVVVPSTKMLLSSPRAWGHCTGPTVRLPDTPRPACPALPSAQPGVGDVALLPQDLICVLIDDGGFLVLSNQEDHWYQVSGACLAALLSVGCQRGAVTS